MIAGAVTMLGEVLESDFIFDYLQNNIIGLLITLLAINTATLGLIASKIQDIVVQFPEFNFTNTIKQMKLSLLEQIVLICVSIMSLLLMDSAKIDFEYKMEVGNTLLVAILIYAINILWDTGKGVFTVIEQLQKMKRK